MIGRSVDPYGAEPEPNVDEPEITSKRLMGFEPTTFCMAITPAIWRVQHQNPLICRRFSGGVIGARRRQYAWMCADMRRFGHFWPEVPEIEETGSNRRAVLKSRLQRAARRETCQPG